MVAHPEMNRVAGFPTSEALPLTVIALMMLIASVGSAVIVLVVMLAMELI